MMLISGPGFDNGLSPIPLVVANLAQVQLLVPIDVKKDGLKLWDKDEDMLLIKCIFPTFHMYFGPFESKKARDSVYFSILTAADEGMVTFRISDEMLED